MGNFSITPEIDREKEVKQGNFDWEERFSRQACQLAQEEAEEYFQEVDEQLFKQRPVGWESRGFEERTYITSFGELRRKEALP